MPGGRRAAGRGADPRRPPGGVLRPGPRPRQPRHGDPLRRRVRCRRRAGLDRRGRPVQPQDRPGQHRQHLPPAHRGRGGARRGGVGRPDGRSGGVRGRRRRRAARSTICATSRRAGGAGDVGARQRGLGPDRGPRRAARPAGRAAPVRPGGESQPVDRRRGAALRHARPPNARARPGSEPGAAGPMMERPAGTRRGVLPDAHLCQEDGPASGQRDAGRHPHELPGDPRSSPPARPAARPAPDTPAVADRAAHGRLRRRTGGGRSARRQPRRWADREPGRVRWPVRRRSPVRVPVPPAGLPGRSPGGGRLPRHLVRRRPLAGRRRGHRDRRPGHVVLQRLRRAARGVPDRAGGSDRYRHGRPGGRSGPDLAAGPGRRRVRRTGARGARDRRPPFARTTDRRGGGRGRRRLPRGDRRPLRWTGPATRRPSGCTRRG